MEIIIQIILLNYDNQYQLGLVKNFQVYKKQIQFVQILFITTICLVLQAGKKLKSVKGIEREKIDLVIIINQLSVLVDPIIIDSVRTVNSNSLPNFCLMSLMQINL